MAAGISFSGMENLTDGVGVDTFVLAPGGTVGGTVDGAFAGGVLDCGASTLTGGTARTGPSPRCPRTWQTGNRPRTSSCCDGLRSGRTGRGGLSRHLGGLGPWGDLSAPGPSGSGRTALRSNLDCLLSLSSRELGLGGDQLTRSRRDKVVCQPGRAVGAPAGPQRRPSPDRRPNRVQHPRSGTAGSSGGTDLHSRDIRSWSIQSVNPDEEARNRKYPCPFLAQKIRLSVEIVFAKKNLPSVPSA